MTQKAQLKACPFCGGKASLFEREFTDHEADYGNAYVWCETCLAENPYCQNAAEAIAAWNTRTPDGVIAELVEAVRRYREARRVQSQWDDRDTTKAFDRMLYEVEAAESELDEVLAKLEASK